MAFSKKPVTGMKDIQPAEMQIRDYLIALIKQTYKGYGFTPIETPCFESIGNLSGKQGGENEKLIFKVLKRGEKLNLADAKEENDVVDYGLRYDLTVPLSRFYANNQTTLPRPFKALQIGPVWRADRPQKGRFRQFYQCDIDILGDPSWLAEIELILATTAMLGKIGFTGFTVHINDRRVLKAMAAYAGFPADRYDEVFIILDKMDKIGLDGVRAELVENGFAQEAVDAYCGLFSDGLTIDTLSAKVDSREMAEAAASLSMITESVAQAQKTDCKLVFDPTLVRGMSYYTGTIFEITMEGFSGSVAGGGRYDEMIGRFTGQPTPAVGFSIGFERIVTILLDQGYQVPGAAEKVAFLVEKGMDASRLAEVMREAQAVRDNGATVLVSIMNKNKKFQKEQLTAEGYTDFREFYREALRN